MSAKKLHLLLLTTYATANFQLNVYAVILQIFKNIHFCAFSKMLYKKVNAFTKFFYYKKLTDECCLQLLNED